jgi:hypothetical protein
MLKKGETIFREYVYDFAVDGGATGTKVLRAADGLSNALDEGLLVKDVVVLCETAVTSAGSATLTLGTGADTDGFMVDAMAKVAADNATVRAGELDGALIFDTTADAKKAYRVGSVANTQSVVAAIGTAALTAGKLRVILECYMPGSEVGAI